MFAHSDIWRGIDGLASSLGYSASGLAKKAGLDPTAFNKSKRISPDGKPRWPSTESLSKILNVTGATMSDFISILDAEIGDVAITSYTIPVVSFADVGEKGYFDENGYRKEGSWNELALPFAGKEGLYGIEVSDDSMRPLYRPGDTLILDPNTRVRKGDRIVTKLKNGDVMVKTLAKRTNTEILLRSLNPKHKNLTIKNSNIVWMVRVIWVSQ